MRNEKEHRKKAPAKQAFREAHSEPNKIGASIPYEFKGKNLTPYGGLLPVATVPEKLVEGCGQPLRIFLGESDGIRCLQASSIENYNQLRVRLMLRRFIFELRVVRFIPRRAAAPSGPPTCQSVARNICRMCSLSASSRVRLLESGAV